VATVKNSEKETSTVEKCSAMRYAMNMYVFLGIVYVYLYLAVSVFACVCVRLKDMNYAKFKSKSFA